MHTDTHTATNAGTTVHKLLLLKIHTRYRHKHAIKSLLNKLIYSNLRNIKVSKHFHNADGVVEGQTASLLYSSWTCFKEKTKEGGRQRDIVFYTHDKPRHTARCPNNGPLWRERWCPLGVLIGTLYSIH